MEDTNHFVLILDFDWCHLFVDQKWSVGRENIILRPIKNRGKWCTSI